jgi:hypothetical protein
MIVHPALYHWILLLYCALVASFMGILALTGGAAPDSRFYAIDRVVVRLQGAGLVIFSVLIFLRQNWTFYGLTSCCVISIVESLVTVRPDATSTNYVQRHFSAWVAFLLLVFGIPVSILIWLRPIFTAD